MIKAVIWSPNTERVCGVPLVERTLRALKQAGIREAYFSSWTLPFDDFEGIAVGPFSSLYVSDGEAALLLMGDRLFDPRLISEMARRQVPTLLLDDSGGRIRLAQNGNGHWSVSDAKDALAWVGIASLDNAALARLACRLRNDNDTTLVDHLLDGQAFEALMVNEVDPYIPKLRRELRPYWAELATLTDRRRAASYLMDSASEPPADGRKPYFSTSEPISSTASRAVLQRCRANAWACSIVMICLAPSSRSASSSFRWPIVVSAIAS